MPNTTRQSSGDLAVEASGLTKRFGANRAVDGVGLAIARGSVYGVLGPNGAGKTTTLRILATLLRPDAGTARVLGHDVVHDAAAVRARISLTGQFASVDEELTAQENLILLGRLLGHSRRQARQRANDLLEAFDLTPAAGRLVAQFSGGMRRRLDIAASIFVTPELLFLDEPTTGLDPRSRNHVWETIRMIVAQGTTVLLTTQYLDEADQLADRIAVIDHGKVIAEGTRSELKASVGAGGLRVRLLSPAQRDEAEQLLAAGLGVPVHRDADADALTARIPMGDKGGDSAHLVAVTLAELARSGIAIGDFALGQPSLDEVFLDLTGSPAESPNHEAEALA